MASAIAFDSYGTLFQTERLRQVAESLYPGRGDELFRTWREKQLEYAWASTLTGAYHDFWTITAAALTYAAAKANVHLTGSARRRLLQTHLTLPVYPDVRKALTPLAGSGLQLAILSEGTLTMLRCTIRQNDLQGYFDPVIGSDEIRTYKPAAQPYQALALRLTAAPADTLFVTAHAWDVAGAGVSGFRTVWLNRHGEPWTLPGAAPDSEIRGLAELPPLVRAR
jgi:2-haloacid dehalogenase